MYDKRTLQAPPTKHQASAFHNKLPPTDLTPNTLVFNARKILR